MIAPDPVSLGRPFGVDKLLEIRTSAMKKMAGIDVMSGIDKTIVQGPMKLTKLGLEGDEHDPTFHGGPDKAILGCESHIHFLMGEHR
jgi:MOSC domain-containing protein YiiM